MESRELAWFDVPVRAAEAGPVAEVRTLFGGAEHVWSGRVTRMEAQVDASSRMVHVIVEVPRPYRRDGGRPPLLPGAFVDVSIEGSTMKNVVPVPRHAVRTDDSVWVVEDGRLRIRPVEVTRADRDKAYVTSGLQPGDLVVVSALDAVTDGMKVRPAGDGAGGPGIPPDAGDDVGVGEEEAA
jgi:RND family efflux transporter MFP subunit